MQLWMEMKFVSIYVIGWQPQQRKMPFSEILIKLNKSDTNYNNELTLLHSLYASKIKFLHSKFLELSNDEIFTESIQRNSLTFSLMNNENFEDVYSKQVKEIPL